jgi:hypothetical protein
LPLLLLLLWRCALLLLLPMLQNLQRICICAYSSNILYPLLLLLLLFYICCRIVIKG